MNANLKRFEITLSQFQIMIYLEKNKDKEISQKQICDFLKVKHTSLIDVLKRLEAKGFVDREANPNNARLNSVKLSEKGMKLIKEVKLEKKQMSDVVLQNFSKQEEQQLEYLLNKVLKNLEIGDDDNDQSACCTNKRV